MGNTEAQEEKKGNKKRFLILIILLGGLTAFSAFSGYVAFVKNPTKMEKLNKESDNHLSRAQKLQGEIEKVNVMLDKLGIENSEEGVEKFTEEQKALRAEAEKQKKKLMELQEKMKQLIELSDGGAADPETFVEMYRKIKAEHWALNNEVNKLRRKNKELDKANKKLKSENSELTTALNNERIDKKFIIEEREGLRKQVQKAAILKVRELSADGIRIVRSGKEKTSKKARKAEKIRVAFTLPENEVTTPGNKTVYMVIKGPDKQVMTDGGSNFMFEGKSIAYTVKDQVEYKNKETDMMMYGKNLFKDKFDKGTYEISLYCEGSKIGTTTLTLR